MEGFLRMKEDLDKIIQNDFEIYEDDDDPPSKSEKSPTPTITPTSSSATIDTSSPSKKPDASSSSSPPPPPPSGEEPPLSEKMVAFFERSNLKQFMATNLFQICIIILVILDCVFVILEVVIDLGALYSYHGGPESGWALFFHVTSFLILNIFLIEFGLKLYVYQREFFSHKLEIFDAVVVLVAWCLDVALLVIDERTAVISIQLLIILRLWRVARVINGIVQGVVNRNRAKLKKQKDAQSTLAAEVDQLKLANSKLEEELTHLRTVARKYGVPESSLQRYRTTSSCNSLERAEVGVAAKKADVAVVQMTQESEFL